MNKSIKYVSYRRLMVSHVCIHRSKSFSDLRTSECKLKNLVKTKGHVNTARIISHMTGAITKHTDLEIMRIRKEVNNILKMLNKE